MDILEFTPMTKQEMIEFLAGMEELEKKLPEFIEDASDKVESLEESISRNSLKSPGAANGGGHSESTEKDQVFRILLNARRDMERQRKEASEEVMTYVRAQEKVACVKRLMNGLPLWERDLIEKIYVEKMPRKAYASETGVSDKQLWRMDRKALSDLLDRYNARFENGKEKKEEHENE